jgi:hypothetical protein
MLIKSKSTAKDNKQNRCLSCGTTKNMKARRYCSIKCRQNLRQKLNTRSGLLQALNTRYATFYFSDTMVFMDVVPHGIKEIFRYTSCRMAENNPAEDFSKMANMLGKVWWEEEKRTTKKYLASRRVLELATKYPAIISLRPKVINVPNIKINTLNYLGIDKVDLNSAELRKIIKNSYRKQAKIHHPDLGGHAPTFRKLHAAYQELLHWAENPTFIHRRGFADKWFYDGEYKKWVQPIPIHK